MLKRKTVRQKCIVDARIYIDGQPAMDCSINDVTPEGAQLTIKKPLPRLLRKVLIFIPSIGTVWAAQIRWHRGLTLGVEFVVGEADLLGTENAPNPILFALRMQTAQLSNNRKRTAASKGKTQGEKPGPVREKLFSPSKKLLFRKDECANAA